MLHAPLAKLVLDCVFDMPSTATLSVNPYLTKRFLETSVYDLQLVHLLISIPGIVSTCVTRTHLTKIAPLLYLAPSFEWKTRDLISHFPTFR